MNEYGQWWNDINRGKTKVLGEKHYTKWVVSGWMSRKQCWNDTAEAKLPGEKRYTAWFVGRWMGMEKWWNDTDRENWSTGRKTLYSVCGRWMNEYVEKVEWYWQEKTEVLGEKHYTGLVVDGWMSMEQWWNDTDKENWITGRKTLYRVVGRWMNGYGEKVEWYWQEKTEVLAEKHYTAWVVVGWKSMEEWWNVLTVENWSTGQRNVIQSGW